MMELTCALYSLFMCVCLDVCIYILILFFPLIGYYKMLNIVLCAIQ